MRITSAIESWIGDDVGKSHAAEAVQWSVVSEGRRETGSIGCEPDVQFDIASVSKLFTATIAMIAVDEKRVEWTTPISTFFPNAKNGTATMQQLLNHTSGYPAWVKYYEKYPWPMTEEAAVENGVRIKDAICDTAFVLPPGVRAEYSDLGYMMLGYLLEKVFDERLHRVVASRIVEPLGLEKTQYVFCEAPIAAVRTELDDRRQHVTDQDGAVCGVVHDENCYIQGGVAGHAGAFSTADDLLSFGRHMRDIADGESGIVKGETLNFAWDRSQLGAGGHHVLGWDTPSGDRTSVGRGFTRNETVGHLGFTGTSLWIDRRTKTVASLLTNRVYPSRENAKILDLRIDFHEAVQPQ